MFPPDEYRARARIDDDIEAILRAVVDNDVQIERRGNSAAGALHDEDARELKAFRLEPALRLPLRGGPGGRRALGQKNDFPAALDREAAEPFDHAGLELIEPFPEILSRGHVLPQLLLLTRRHVHLQQRGRVVERRFRRPPAAFVVRRVAGTSGWRRHNRLDRRFLQAAGYRVAEQDLGLSEKLRVHIGKDAVQIDPDAQRHCCQPLTEAQRRVGRGRGATGAANAPVPDGSTSKRAAPSPP